jgi:hypothetical protein
MAIDSPGFLVIVAKVYGGWRFKVGGNLPPRSLLFKSMTIATATCSETMTTEDLRLLKLLEDFQVAYTKKKSLVKSKHALFQYLVKIPWVVEIYRKIGSAKTRNQELDDCSEALGLLMLELLDREHPRLLAFDPSKRMGESLTAKFAAWTRSEFYFRLKDVRSGSGKKIDHETTSLDKKFEDNDAAFVDRTQPQSLFDRLELQTAQGWKSAVEDYINTDPNGELVKSCCPTHPQCNSQILAQMRTIADPPATFEAIAAIVATPRKTVEKHYKEQTIPLVRSIAEALAVTYLCDLDTVDREMSWERKQRLKQTRNSTP